MFDSSSVFLCHNAGMQNSPKKLILRPVHDYQLKYGFAQCNRFKKPAGFLSRNRREFSIVKYKPNHIFLYQIPTALYSINVPFSSTLQFLYCVIASKKRNGFKMFCNSLLSLMSRGRLQKKRGSVQNLFFVCCICKLSKVLAEYLLWTVIFLIYFTFFKGKFTRRS